LYIYIYMNIVIFWDVMPCSSVYRYHVLKELAASMFKVQGYFYSEVGGHRFLPNVVPTHQTAWHCIPGDDSPGNYRHENVKSQMTEAEDSSLLGYYMWLLGKEVLKFLRIIEPSFSGPSSLPLNPQ